MNRRVVFFIILTIAIFIIHYQVILPWYLKQRGIPTKPPLTTAPSPEPVTTTAIAPVTPEPLQGKPIIPIAPSGKESELMPDIVLSNDYLTITFTNKGAAIKSILLNKYNAPYSLYPGTKTGQHKLELVREFEPDRFSFTLKEIEGDASPASPAGGFDIGTRNWSVVTQTDTGIVFQILTSRGVVITKEFSLNPFTISPTAQAAPGPTAVLEPSGYALKYRITIQNPPANPAVPLHLLINGAQGLESELVDHTDLKGVRSYQEGNNPQTAKWGVIEETDVRGLRGMEKEGKQKVLVKGTESIVWIGAVSRYFAVTLIPLNPDTAGQFNKYGFGLIGDQFWEKAEHKRREMRGETFNPTLESALKNEARNNIAFYQETVPITVTADAPVILDFLIFAGPKSAPELAKLEAYGVNHLLGYGFFGFISNILLGIMGIFYAIFGNYGWSIIFLTILVKIILFPLTRKGQVSAYKLQQLQPKIKALQQMYKDDKKKLGMEQLKLFRDHKVSPLSGCLPLLFQIPVFFGLYWALYSAIDLRQAHFLAWIMDLSQPDKLCPLPFSILGATDLHLLPLLMTASWLIQTLTQPRSPDPQTRQQQKIFVFMPLIFLLFFYNVPSGLTLYWFIQTLASIGEQYLIKKVYLKIT